MKPTFTKIYPDPLVSHRRVGVLRQLTNQFKPRMGENPIFSKHPREHWSGKSMERIDNACRVTLEMERKSRETGVS